MRTFLTGSFWPCPHIGSYVVDMSSWSSQKLIHYGLALSVKGSLGYSSRPCRFLQEFTDSEFVLLLRKVVL